MVHGRGVTGVLVSVARMALGASKVADHFFRFARASLRGRIFFLVFFFFEKSHKPSWLVGFFRSGDFPEKKGTGFIWPSQQLPSRRDYPRQETKGLIFAGLSRPYVRDKQVAKKQPSRNPLMNPLFLVGG